MTTKKNAPSWSDVKSKLADLDRQGLIGLNQDQHGASKENQLFLHARFGLGDDVLKPCKAMIDRWLCPDVFQNQNTSVAKAKKAITDYKKAVGQAENLAELMVYFCERAVGFCQEYGPNDAGYHDAMVRMFEQALKAVAGLPDERRSALQARLIAVRRAARNLGYGVGYDMDSFLALHELDAA